MVDNVHVREAPTCPSPLVSNFGVSNLTSSNGELTWLAGGNETFWAIEWGPSGFPQGTGNYDTTNLFFGYPISNLNPTTNYDFYVQAICGAGDSSYWAGPFTFTTPCAVEIPNYTQGFDTYPGYCWSEANGPTPSGTSSGWGSDGFGNVGNTGAARFNIYGSLGDEWLISPTFDLSNGGYEINLDVALIHVNKSDEKGNTQIVGPDPFFDELFARAASKTFVSAEEVVSTQDLGGKDGAIFNRFERSLVTGVLHAPCGAHPTSCAPNYGFDIKHLKEYSEAAKSFDEYSSKYLNKSHQDYIDSVGGSEAILQIPLPQF